MGTSRTGTFKRLETKIVFPITIARRSLVKSKDLEKRISLLLRQLNDLGQFGPAQKDKERVLKDIEIIQSVLCENVAVTTRTILSLSQSLANAYKKTKGPAP